MSAAPAMTPEQAAEAVGVDAVAAAARRAMWRAGDLSYHCSDVQLAARALVYEHPSRRVVWETSRRFGKSRTGVTISGEHAAAFPGIRIPYAAPTAQQVRTFVHPHMLELSSHAPDDIAPELVAGAWVFPPLQWYDAAGNPVRTKLAGGVELARFKGSRAEEALRMSRVAPHGCEDRRKADALRGTGTVLAVVDEARDIPILTYVLGSVLGPMLWEARSRWSEDADPTMLVISTPASEPEHPFNEVADAARDRGAYLHATVYDCDHLSDRDIEEAIEEAGGESSVAWQVEGLAKRTRDPSTVAFPEYDRERHVTAAERPEHFLPVVIGDGGHVDLSVYAFGFYDFARAVYVVEDELVFRRTRSDVVAAAIEAKERELWGSLGVEQRRVDAPPQVRADMSRPGQLWQAVSKPRAAKRLGSMQAGVNAARVLLQQGRIELHPRCSTIIAHVDGCRWSQDRTSFARVRDEKGEPLHHYDGAAALVYFVRDANAHENPFPAVPEGAGLPNHFVRKQRLRSSVEDKWRDALARSRKARS